MKVETHMHTSQVSPCGKLSAEEMVIRCRDAGYDLLIITDHYFDGFFDKLGDMPWQRKADLYLSGYRAAREQAEKLGITALLGMEIRFAGYGPEDFLLYGITEEDVPRLPKLYEYMPDTFANLRREKDWMLIQAHPTRPGLREAEADWIDAVETFNGNPRQHLDYPRAKTFASRIGKPEISGSDAHQAQDIGRGGIYLPDGVCTIHEVKREILGGVELITTDI